jgi:hypothetical protein
MRRPVWLRVLVQVVLAAVLYAAVLPGLAILHATSLRPISSAEYYAGIGPTGRHAIFTWHTGLLYVLAGALAALLTWIAVGSPWDSLGAFLLLSLPVLANGWALAVVVAHTTYRGPHAATVTAEVLGLFAGSALVAWSLWQRTNRLPGRSRQAPRPLRDARLVRDWRRRRSRSAQ